MTAKELITQLQKFDLDTEVWLPVTTRHGITTYAALAHIVPYDYGSLASGITGTHDNIDMRLLDGRVDETVIVHSSMFDFKK